jgi:hypothetical protein
VFTEVSFWVSEENVTFGGSDLIPRKSGFPHLKVVSSEKVGGSGVTSALGTWYGGLVMGVLLSFNEI